MKKKLDALNALSKVYAMEVKWAYNGESDSRLEIYKTEEAAIDAMEVEAFSAMKEFNVLKTFRDGYYMLKKSQSPCGEVCRDGWILEISPSSLEFYEDGEWCSNHCQITVTEKECKALRQIRTAISVMCTRSRMRKQVTK